MDRIFWSRGGWPQEKISITKEENHVFGPIFLDIPIFFKGDAKNYRFLSLSKFCIENFLHILPVQNLMFILSEICLCVGS